MKKEDKTLRRILVFVLLSLLLHLGMGIFFYEIHSPRVAAPLPPPPPEEVVFVNPQDLLQEPTQPSGPMEMADIAKPKVEQAPKKARFASQYNSTVKEETVAKKIPPKAKLKAEVSEENGNKGQEGQEIKKTPPKLAAKPHEAEEAKEELVPEKPPEEKPEKELSYSDLSLQPGDFSEFMPKDKKPKDSSKVAMKSKETWEPYSRQGKPGSPGAGDQFVHDFFPNIKIGDKTYLNTAAFPDVQYFTQLKRIFRMRFNPEPPLRHHLMGNRIVLGKVNVTMAMTVSANGQLTELFVVRSSGIPGYDEEALQTVRESSPFSAPPQKVLDKNGNLRMTWSFITYL